VYAGLPYRITGQHFVQPSLREPVPNHDARLVGTEDLLPPAVVLDYFYGVAAYQCWRSDKDSVPEVLESYFREHYEPILRQEHPIPTDDTDNGQEDTNGDDGSDDPSWYSTSTHNSSEYSARRPQECLDAMDVVLNLSLRMQQQTIPQEVVARVQQQQHEEQLRERDVSRTKVEEWRRTMDNSSV
jgi:hypothetical protein